MMSIFSNAPQQKKKTSNQIIHNGKLKLNLPPLIHSIVNKIQKINNKAAVQLKRPKKEKEKKRNRKNSILNLTLRSSSSDKTIVSWHSEEQIHLPIDIPTDCLYVILEYLDYLSILRLPFVSTQFYRLFRQSSMDGIWNRIIIQQYSIISDDNNRLIERRSEEIQVEGQSIHGLRSIEAYQFLRNQCCYQCGSCTKNRIRYRVCSRFVLNWYKGPKSVRLCTRCHEHGTIEKKELKPELYGISTQEGGCLPMCVSPDGSEHFIPKRICYEACLYKNGISVLQLRMKIRSLELKEYIRGMAWVENDEEIGKPNFKFNQSVKMAVSRFGSSSSIPSTTIALTQ